MAGITVFGVYYFFFFDSGFWMLKLLELHKCLVKVNCVFWKNRFCKS